jgi:hypothetical protein
MYENDISQDYEEEAKLEKGIFDGTVDEEAQMNREEVLDKIFG